MDVNFKFDVGDTAYYFNTNGQLRSGEIESVSYKKSEDMLMISNHTYVTYKLKQFSRTWDENELYKDLDDILYYIRQQFDRLQ